VPCSQGHFERVAELARPAPDAAPFSQTERGKEWGLLGSAYENQGQFQEAMSAYKNAIGILENEQ
jgi:hypothetical protein